MIFCFLISLILNYYVSNASNILSLKFPSDEKSERNMHNRAGFEHPSEILQILVDKKRNVTDAFVELKREFFNKFKKNNNEEENNGRPQENAPQKLSAEINSIRNSFFTPEINSIRNSFSTPERVPTSQVTQDDINFLITYLKNVYLKETEGQKFQDTIVSLGDIQQNQNPSIWGSNHNDFNSLSNDLSLLDVLQGQIQRPASSPPNDIFAPASSPPSDIFANIINNIPQKQTHETVSSYADKPYIPAIHGNQDFIQDTHDLVSSHLNTQPTKTTNNTRISGITGSGTFSNCLQQSACILAVALVVATATTSAIGLPLFFGKRRKRSTDNTVNEREDALRFINNLRSQNFESIRQSDSGSIFNLLSGTNSSDEKTSVWKTHQDSINFLTEKKANDKLSTDALENLKEVSNKSKTIRKIQNISTEVPSNNETDNHHKHNFKEIQINLNRTSNLSEERNRKDYDDLEEESRMENSNTEMLSKLRSQLNNYFNKVIESSYKLVNISTNYKNTTRITLPESSSENNLEGLLKILLDKIENTKNNNYGQESTPNNLKTILFQDWLKQFMWNQQNIPTSNINTAAPAKINIPAPGNNVNIHKLIQIIDKLNSQANQDNPNSPLNSLIQLISQSSVKKQQQHINPVPVGQGSLNFLKLPPLPIINENSQHVVPTKTVTSIIQDPNVNQEQLQSILLKLPQLLTDIRKPNEPKPSSNNPTFSPTVILRPQNSSVQSVKPQSTGPNKETTENTLTSNVISADTKKFYSILCKAILLPDIPLNKITAYIAEKCLVMRFTGLINR